jgi:hypothetical protein
MRERDIEISMKRADNAKTLNNLQRYIKWAETVNDRIAACGGKMGILVDGQEIGSVVESKLKISNRTGGKGASSRNLGAKTNESSLIEGYAAMRRSHNENYYRIHGHSAPRRLTDALFDSEHGAGSAKKAAELTQQYYRKIHRERLSALEKLVSKGGNVVVNGVKFFAESGRWVTNETDAPPSLLSRSTRLAAGDKKKGAAEVSAKNPYPYSVEGLIKLSKETAPDFLALVVTKMQEKEKLAGKTSRIADRGLARPADKTLDGYSPQSKGGR